MTIPENYVLFINIFIVLLYLIMIYFGYKRGFIFGIVNILYNIFALFVAWLISPVLASEFPFIKADKLIESGNLIFKLIDVEPLLNTVFYFVCTFIVLRVLYLFVSLFAKSVNSVPVFGSLNKLIGALIGVFNATIIITVLSLLLALPIFANGNTIKNKTIFKYIEKYTNMAVDYGMEHLDVDSFKDNFNEFDSDEFRNQLKEWINNNRHEQ